ncbi:creatininase family protein [Natrononativus amylolyticus]|uniref:creatininase family protein n=1 Tax=Natrononativus amylolyticus TaxID=2963434 RepID=UPI0020CDB38A|nr:creatininase family protein [Natrononativus amylolyticus]
MFLTGTPDRRYAWASLPYEAIKETGETPGSVLVLPVGSIEQHGHHLPVATDTLLVTAVADAAVSAIADDVPVVLAPTVWSGHSPHHRDFGGTLSLRFETLKRVLEDVADSALDNGFDAVILVNGHGGNKNLIGAATGSIGRAHPETEVMGLTYFDLAADAIEDLRESDTSGMAHGGEYETSLMLHLYDELVDTEATEAVYYDDHYDHAGVDLLRGGPLGVYRSFAAYSDSGAIGDSELASAEKGSAIFDLVRSELADVVRAAHEATA